MTTTEQEIRDLSPEDLSTEEAQEVAKGIEALFAWMFGDTPEESKEQFPYELSALLKSVVPDNTLIYAIGAGDGSIIKAFDTAWSFGIEADEKLSRRRKGSYNAVVGEFDKVADLMELVGVEMGHAVIDLTRGADPKATITRTRELMEDYRQALYLVSSREAVEALHKLDCVKDGLYAAVSIPELDLAVSFWIDPDLMKVREEEQEVATRGATLDTLDLLGNWLAEQRQLAQKRSWTDLYSGDGYTSRDKNDVWKAIHQEYGRRFLGRATARGFDVQLVSGKLIAALPSKFATKALTHLSRLPHIQNLHNKPVTAFAQNPGAYDTLLVLADREVITVDPRLIELGAEIVHEARRVTTPLYRVPLPMRLGWLHEVQEIKCRRTDEDRGFVAGKYYGVRVFERSTERYFTKPEADKDGAVVHKKKKRQIHFLEIRIGDARFEDTKFPDIRYILRHFELPDPGDLASRYPELVQAHRDVVKAVSDKYLTPRSLALKAFQAEDIARVLAQDSGIVSWEQGLGKTLGGLTFIHGAFEKGCQQAALVVVPQDLIPQWKREAKRFFGIEPTVIGGNGKGADFDLVQARTIAQKLKDPEATGIYITYYEALAQTGQRLTVKTEPHIVGTRKATRYVPAAYDEQGKYVPTHTEEYDEELWSTEYCPRCKTAWNGEFCRNRSFAKADGRKVRSKVPCGYSIYGGGMEDGPAGRPPTIANIIAGSFKRGVIVVDEGTQISNESQRSEAVRGLRGQHRLLMTGTPIKNFIAQAFWLLWWALGAGDGQDTNNPGAKRFPYGYAGGKTTFTNLFSCFEWTWDEENSRWGNKKAVGEITNLSRLWRQLSSSLIRKRKEDTGERIVPKKVHIIETPLGVRQREVMDHWRLYFPDFFAEKYPEKKVVKSGAHVHMAPMLGLDVKWNYACVLPQADPDHEWTGIDVSNWTPMTLKTLQTAMALVKQGRKVLLGVDLVKSVEFFTQQLQSKGVVAINLLDGSGKLAPPKKRSVMVEAFQEGDAEVLVATIPSIRLGHNLDAGSAVIFHGLQWDYESHSQFEARVHRLTSELPVDAYVMLSGERHSTLLGRKWDTVEEKTRGAQTALDGTITEVDTTPIDIPAIVKQLMEQGIPVVGNEVEEDLVWKTWDETPHIDGFEIPWDFKQDQAEEKDAYDPKRMEFEATWRCDDCDAGHSSHEWFGNIALCPPWASGVPYEEAFDTLGLSPEGVPHAEWFTQPSEEELAAAEAVAAFLRNAWIVYTTPKPEAEEPEVEPEVEPEAESPPDEPVQEQEAPVETPLAAPVDISQIREELREFGELHKDGILDDEEFADIKAALIARLKAAAKPAPPTTATAGAATEQLSLIA